MSGSPYYYSSGGYKPAPLPPARRPAAATPAARPAAAAPPAGPPYPGWMSPEDQQALALAQAHGAYDPVIELYQKQQQRQSMMNMAQQAGLAKLYDILGGSMAGFSGQVSDIYNTAAQGLSSFDAGYGHGVELAKQSLQAQGAGYGQAFGALPAISGQQGAVKYLTAVQEGQAADQKLQDLIDSTAAEIPGKVQSFLADIQTGQAKLQSDYTTVQLRQADLALKSGNAGLAQAWKVAAAFTKGTGRTYVAVIDKNGNPQVVDTGKSVTKPTKHHYTATAGGDVLDTSTGKVVGQVTVKPSAPGKPTYWTDSTTGDRHMTTGQGVDTIIVPGTKKPAGGKVPTPGQVTTMVSGWYTGKPTTTLQEQPNTDAQGNPVYRKVPAGRTGQKNYQQAYRALRAMNLGDVQARQILDTYYKRGERNRPYLNAPQRTALKRAKQPLTASYIKDAQGTWHAYITPDQVAALQAAGMLPPGERAAAGGLKSRGYSLAWIYYIKP